MADFGLNVHVRAHDDHGPDLPDADVFVEPVPARTGQNGVCLVEDFLLTVRKPGYRPYEKQPYHRPSLQAEVPVSLQDADLPAVHCEGVNFVDAYGHRWLWCGMSAFKLLAKYRDGGGDAVRPVLTEWSNLARKHQIPITLRVFREYNDPGGLGVLVPGQTPNYDDLVRNVTDLVGAYGLYIEWTAGDFDSVYGGDMGAFKAAGAHFCWVVSSRPHVFFEWSNEAGHGNNALRPQDLYKPSEAGAMLVSNASPLGGYAPPQPFLDYVTDHPRRDLPKLLLDAQLVEQRDVGWAGFPATQRPTIGDEPIGFDEVAQDNKRSNDPRLAGQLGRAYGNLNGGTFHSTDGLNCDLMRPITAACADAFVAGIKAGYYA